MKLSEIRNAANVLSKHGEINPREWNVASVISNAALPMLVSALDDIMERGTGHPQDTIERLEAAGIEVDDET